MTDLESNLHQGCFSASYSEHRKKLGVYPTSHGVVDPSKRLHIDSYSIFVHQDETKVEVRDGTIKGLDLKKDQICVQSDYSIISDLRTMGFKVTDTLRTTDACFNLLINKRVRAVATLTDKGLFIAQNKEYSDKIKVLANALLQKPYYLIFSYDFFLESPEMVRSIFLEIEKIRESPEYKEELANVLKNRSPSSFVDEY